jgi:transposase-like protein
VIQLNDKQYWLYAAVDTETNELVHTQLGADDKQRSCKQFLAELHEKHDVDDAVFLIDGSPFVERRMLSTKSRPPCQTPPTSQRHRTYLSRGKTTKLFIFRTVFINAEAEPTDEWLQKFAFAWNQLI